MNTMNSKIIKDGYTFDDVLLVPQKSEVMPDTVLIETQLTKNITLNVPVLSAAMDTVTEASLAIALARQGGIGIIHKNMSIEDQVREVDKVKRNESGMITNPLTLELNSTLEDAENILSTYKISGLPIIDKNGVLAGIITNRDLKYREIDKTSIAEIMTKDNLVTAKVGISTEEAKAILLENRIEKLPIVDNSYHLKGLITIKDIDNARDYPSACKDNQGRLRVGAAIGISADVLKRVEALYKSGVDIIAVDSAHGHSIGILKGVELIKKAFPGLNVIAGNVVTKEAAIDLVKAGADAIKVGIGPGSICTTRIVAGVGMPQLTAINDVAEALKETEIGVIADGGITFSGDVVKAIAAGADCVMLGSFFAGSEEAPGEEVVLDGRKYKAYVGMGSIAAMARGSKDRYFQQGKEAKKLVPEGIEGRVPYKGNIEDIIYQLAGGLRAGMGYCGTATIKELKENAKFVKITGAGLKESHPHHVMITKAAPNY